VPATAGVHEQILLKSSDPADNRQKSGLESSRRLFTSWLLPWE
jgi:hypothetical protein